MGKTLKNIKFNPRNPESDSVYISSDFGMRTITLNGVKKTSMHNGIDITDGTKIYAIEQGTITAIRKSIKGKDTENSAGNYIKIKHPNGATSVYYHLKYGSIKVNVGDKVSRGQYIADEGSTGNVTGPHLHLGIYVSGKWVDPKPYLLGTKILYVESTENTSSQTTISKQNITYIVKKGDNLTKIAKKYNTTWKKIYNDNKNIIGSNPNIIKVGQKLVIK